MKYKTWLNLDRLDPMGPMQYNDELKDYIIKNGFNLNEKQPDILAEGYEYAGYSKDVVFCHKPSGKVSAYRAYGYIKTGDIRTFNGFFDVGLGEDIRNDIYWVYESEETKNMGSFTEFKTPEDRENYINNNFKN